MQPGLKPLPGHTRLDRLLTIGRHSLPISHEAFVLALAEAKRGKDVQSYLDAVHSFQRIWPGDPTAVADQTWMEEKSRQIKGETERLEGELKGYKNNLIKESIRVGASYRHCGIYVHVLDHPHAKR